MSYLKPSQLKEIPIYDKFEPLIKVQLNNDIKIDVLNGSLKQEDGKIVSEFSKLPQIAKPQEVSDILKLVKSVPFDTDPDSVDCMCTHEFYIDSPEIKNGSSSSNQMKKDNDKKILKIRTQIREKLLNIMNPIIKNRITPYVRMLYSQNNELDRQCTPCYCFVRRYKQNERRTHATHRDGHAYATVVISLSDYEKEYRGGIYVATTERYKQTVVLNRGDALVHKYDLLHGVKVKNDGGERWSWILWYKDSTKCKDYSKEWFKAKAYEGIPLYQALYANTGCEGVVEWHIKAANQGFSNSMVKLARGYLKLLKSKLPYNPKEAERLYRNAIKVAQDPHAQYGLAQMLLEGLIIKINNDTFVSVLKEVISLLEESAKGGNVFAMFNLGIVHLYGYTGKQNIELAIQWFEKCNLPEGFMITAMYYDSINNHEKATVLRDRAKKMGYGTPWRQYARKHTGLGGAGGVDINLPWPQLPNGNKPQKW